MKTVEKLIRLCVKRSRHIPDKSFLSPYVTFRNPIRVNYSVYFVFQRPTWQKNSNKYFLLYKHRFRYLNLRDLYSKRKSWLYILPVFLTIVISKTNLDLRITISLSRNRKKQEVNVST